MQTFIAGCYSKRLDSNFFTTFSKARDVANMFHSRHSDYAAFFVYWTHEGMHWTIRNILKGQINLLIV